MRGTAIIASALLLISCGGDDVSEMKAATDASARQSERMADLATVDWNALAGTRIYFGHQSVGANILEGLRELGPAAGTPPLRVESARGGDALGTLYEFRIGENGEPASKMADFAQALAQAGDSAQGVALFKYCYLDITATTDVDALFARHRETVRALRARHPGITLVHVTAPLTTVEPAHKLLVKKMLGKPTARDANARRNAFNSRLRREFAGEPIFDLARVESTRPDGSRSQFVTEGDTVYTLAPEYTDDGGHLNARGRRIAAAELVALLARVAGPTAQTARATP